MQLLFSRWALEFGMSTEAFHRRSSLRLHYRILRSSLARRKLLRAAAWRKTRIHPRRLDALGRLNLQSKFFENR